MNDLTQPHDRLFKALVSHPETAGALLREYLPEEISSLPALTPPRFVEGSFVDEALRGYLPDRLFAATTPGGEPLHIYVLAGSGPGGGAWHCRSRLSAGGDGNDVPICT